jgi:hypothetical protein
VKALQDWRPYLADTEKPIQIYTDHKNLRTLQQQNSWINDRFAELNS